MMTDPIADMLTRIRNAVRVEKPFVDIPSSRFKRGIADVLKREGFIWDWKEVEEENPSATLRLELKYGPNGERVIQSIRRLASRAAVCTSVAKSSSRSSADLESASSVPARA